MEFLTQFEVTIIAVCWIMLLLTVTMNWFANSFIQNSLLLLTMLGTFLLLYAIWPRQGQVCIFAPYY